MCRIVCYMGISSSTASDANSITNDIAVIPSFMEFSQSLAAACFEAMNEDRPVLLCAGPGLDGFCAMYALARCMETMLPELRIACYQTKKGQDTVATTLDTIIRKNK